MQFVQGYFCLLNSSFLLFVILAVPTSLPRSPSSTSSLRCWIASPTATLLQPSISLSSGFVLSLIDLRYFAHSRRNDLPILCKWSPRCADCHLGWIQWFRLHSAHSFRFHIRSLSLQHGFYFVFSHFFTAWPNTRGEEKIDSDSPWILHIGHLVPDPDVGHLRQNEHLFSTRPGAVIHFVVICWCRFVVTMLISEKKRRSQDLRDQS